MRFLYNMKIGLRINLIMSLIMIIIISLLGVYTIRRQKIKIVRDTDLRMFEQVNDLANTISIQLEERQTKVDYALKIAQEILKNNGEITIGDKKLNISAINQISKSVHEITIHNMKIGGKEVYGNYDIVDGIQQFTGATATIFQKIPEGYLRISTNVLKENGDRAVNTFIPNNSPVIQTIESGSIYRGRAYVVHDYYLTAYQPIFIDGTIQAILYVGLKELDLPRLKTLFNNKKYFDSGYPFLIDKNGSFIIHPKQEGENFYDAEFFQQIIKSNQSVGKTHYVWEGEDKFQYFQYIEPIESYVSVSIYEDELLGIINQIRNAIIIAIILGIVIFIIVNIQVSKYITKVLNMGVEFAEKIASGDLSTRININQKDEIGLLATSLNKMAENLKTSMNKYETIFNTANDSLLIIDKNGYIIECNNKAQELFQGTKKQILGKTPIDLSPEYQPNGEKSEMLGFEKINAAFSGNKISFEWIHKKLNNHCFDADVRLNSMLLNNKKYLLCIARDITERKKAERKLYESEEKYRRLTEHSPEITYIYSVNKGALYWSSKVKDILGFDPENLKNDAQKWFKAIHPDDKPKIDDFFKDIEVGKSYTIEYRIYDSNNKMHWFSDKIFNVYRSGDDILVEGIISDITDKIKMQQKVLYAMINAEQRERSRIAKDLHDGVSPVMSAIKLYIQSFTGTSQESLKKELIEKISSTINEAITSINEISNNISPHILQNFGLKAAVESFVSKLSDIKEIVIDLNFDTDIRFNENSEIALYRITTELINNSVKYAKIKSIIIKYYFKRNFVFMMYRDYGIGFDTEKILNRKNGMGMFNIKNRVNALNGEIKIESKVNEGIYVEVMVPLTN